MVQRKQARKKPKDLVVLAEEEVPPGQLRHGGDPGGGVRRTALAPLPNYMRATSCSGAKVGRASLKDASTAPPLPPPTTKREQVRAKVVFAGAPPHAGRATCSSAMKGPVAGSAAAAHVCSYAYCSLKSHVHASVVPLNAFLASRRRLIKTQQSMKLKGASPFHKPNNGGGGEGYFVEIHAGAGAGAAAPPVGSDGSCSGLSTEEMVGRMEHVMFDHLGCGDDDADGKAKDSDASLDGSCGSSIVICADGSLESLGSSAKNRGCKDRETLAVDHEDDYFGACKSDISEELGAEHEGSVPEGEVSDNEIFSDIARANVGIGNQLLIMTKNMSDVGGDAPREYCSSGGISSALSGISFEDVSSGRADAVTSQRKKWHISGRRTSEEDCNQMRPFKPKAPNFLPVETGPEAERVDLRHQELNDRRGAEEWMVDYALRKAVKKLARAQKRKVEMLVQAFETVLPTASSEKDPVQHDDDRSTFSLSRPSQACS